MHVAPLPGTMSAVVSMPAFLDMQEVLHWSDALKSLTASLSNLATLHCEQPCPRVIMCKEARQIYISSTVDRCLTVRAGHACGDCRVSQPGEW